MPLRLFGSPAWLADDGSAVPLPARVPQALVVFLVTQEQPVPREEVAEVFWPGRPAAESQLNLRVNLHKARRWLDEQGIDAEWLIERRRIGLRLPSDLPAGDSAEISADPFLTGFTLAGFEAFDAWMAARRSRFAERRTSAHWRAMAQWVSAGSSELALEVLDCLDDAALPSPLWMQTLVQQAGPRAADAAAALGEALARRRARPSSPEAVSGFHGRAVELAQLRASAEPAIVVAGEAGIGKTRLVQVAQPQAPWLHCREGLDGLPFSPLVELLRAHPEWLHNLGASRLDVARLLPDLAADEPLPPLDALTARHRLFEGLAQVVERQLKVLLVDDLQWADTATLDWLLFLAHRGRTRWVATARRHELPAAAAQSLQALEQRGGLRWIALDGLSRGALRELLNEHPAVAPSGTQADAGLVDWLHRYTAGNAFLAREVLEAMAGGTPASWTAALPVPESAALLIERRQQRLPPLARQVVDAAAVSGGTASLAQLAAMVQVSESDCLAACEAAARGGLLNGTACRHDLVREAVLARLPVMRAQWLHAGAARWLAAQANVDAERVAHHWRAAGDTQQEMPWLLKAAAHKRDLGEREGAAVALERVRSLAHDPALRLYAEIVLAEEKLYDDLKTGREALEAAWAHSTSLPEGEARSRLEARAIGGLIDNAVFSGDLPRAEALIGQMRPHLPRLAADGLQQAHGVMIEAFMRTMRFDDAQASLAELKRLSPASPASLSFEAQIHWFAGRVRESRAAFERLLARHPDYCGALTIENDLAVMCQALGDLPAAEAYARRSLANWEGVLHTETLSLLVLGSTLVSAGRFDEAAEVLARAEAMGRRQHSAMFIANAIARQARLHHCAGDAVLAHATWQRAHAAAGKVVEPLRLSELLLLQVLTAAGVAQPVPAACLQALDALCERSQHPLAHARRWRAHAEAAWQADDAMSSLQAAEQMHRIASLHGLAEMACEALWCQLRAGCEEVASPLADAVRLGGYGWLAAARQRLRTLQA